MTNSLLGPWKHALDSGPRALAKVFRFLLRQYSEHAARAPVCFREPAFQLDHEPRLKLPKSPEQIRSLLVRISSHIRAAGRT